jgi:hypothetical protein
MVKVELLLGLMMKPKPPESAEVLQDIEFLERGKDR